MDKRVKYSSKQKEAIVRSILAGKLANRGAARELGCSTSTIRGWLAQYKRNGSKGFRFRNGSYDGRFKLRVVHYYLKKGISLSQTAAYFKVPGIGVISHWLRTYECSGAEGLLKQGRGRKKSIMPRKSKKHNTPTDPMAQKLAEMQKELAYLRAENAFLKKLEALAQEEEAAKAQARRQKPSGN